MKEELEEIKTKLGIVLTMYNSFLPIEFWQELQHTYHHIENAIELYKG